MRNRPVVRHGFIEFDDTRINVGFEIPIITGYDPLGEYILEGVERSFTQHPHDLCLAALGKQMANPA